MNKGVLYGAGAYFLWGIFPLYFKAIQAVPALQIMFHRVVWSFAFLVLVIVVMAQGGAMRRAITRPRVVGMYAIAAGLLAVNWLVYIWGVNHGYVVESSLGYFINPLVSVALGVFLLHEKLRPLQWVPVGLAGLGVVYLTVQYGSLPWIALALAFSFGLYGLLKKTLPLNGLHSLTLETGILFLPALVYLLSVESQGSGAYGHLGWQATVLLSLAGIITATPLLLFGAAARSIPLSLVGLLQYIAPTLQFLLGVLLYGEPFTHTRLVGFGIIWAALLFFTLEGFFARRQRIAAKVP